MHKLYYSAIFAHLYIDSGKLTLPIAGKVTSYRKTLPFCIYCLNVSVLPSQGLASDSFNTFGGLPKVSLNGLNPSCSVLCRSATNVSSFVLCCYVALLIFLIF